MDDIRFLWSASKERSNRRKHAISFKEAQTVFVDENARLTYDPDHSEDEDRFVLLGVSDQLRLLVVCHVYSEDDSGIRIISARKATKKERAQYQEHLT